MLFKINLSLSERGIEFLINQLDFFVDFCCYKGQVIGTTFKFRYKEQQNNVETRYLRLLT